MDPRNMALGIGGPLGGYCYNYSKLNELVGIATTWKASLQIVALQEATTTTTIRNKLV